MGMLLTWIKEKLKMSDKSKGGSSFKKVDQLDLSWAKEQLKQVAKLRGKLIL